MKKCECGCGEPAPIAKQTRTECGHIKGKPMRFIFGHQSRLQPSGEDSYCWKGGQPIDSNGYRLITKPDHPRVVCAGYVKEHTLVAEKVLGRLLKRNEIVHHVDENRLNNNNNNLVICDRSFHPTIHKRMRQLRKQREVL